MTTGKKTAYTLTGFVLAVLVLTLTGAAIQKDLARVFIENDTKNPVPVKIKDTIEIKGKVELKGNPEIKIDGGQEIRVKSIETPVRIKVEDGENTSHSAIFKKGKTYFIRFDDTSGVCSVVRVNGVWILCENIQSENAISGWINTIHISSAKEV